MSLLISILPQVALTNILQIPPTFLIPLVYPILRSYQKPGGTFPYKAFTKFDEFFDDPGLLYQ
jgi:hypothetical protein